MKTAIKFFLAGLFLRAWTLHASPLSITVSPTVITNNYVGPILLSISNLSSPGAMVRVDRSLDVNNNGVVDASEWAAQSFYVTDGQEPLMGGVRNSNVPGDDDGQNNQTIQSHVPYPGVDLTLEHIAGPYIYRVTDLGTGQTATALLGIAQQILPQGVTGRVYGPDGTTPLSNAPVVVTPQNGNDGFGAISDGSGHFTIYASPGDYQIFTVYPGQVANAGASLTINSNAFTSNNLINVATDGTTVSGRVIDSMTSAGLPGITLQAQTDSGLAAFTATGTNGAYTLLVNSNKWTIELGGGEGSILGYCRGPVHKMTADASSGSVSNINFQLIKGNALVYGTVTTAQSNAVPTLSMQASDTNNNAFNGQGLTDANGNYSVAVVAGGDDVGLNTDLAGYLSPSLAFFTVSSGQAQREDFVLQPISSYLSGVVRDNLGNPIGNIALIADPANDPTGALNENFQSASDGSFTVGVGGGTWYLFVECNTANSSNLISEQLIVNVTSGVRVSNLVLVVQHATATIYGKVTDSSSHPLSFVNMFANATVGTNFYVSGCVSTDTNGDYSILAFPAEWTVGGSFPGMANQDVTITGSSSAMLDFVVSPQSGPPSLGQPVLSGGQFRFQVLGNNGQNYRIDVSSNLLTNGWSPVFTNRGSFPFSNPLGTNYTARFYRAVAVP